MSDFVLRDVFSCSNLTTFWDFTMDVDINVIEEMHGKSYSKNVGEIVKITYVKQWQQHCHYVYYENMTMDIF